MCCPDLEVLLINCKPFYLPREICSFILECLHSTASTRELSFYRKTRWSDHRDRTTTPNVLIILGDFNKANLSRELPNYRQHVTCPTRDSNILDHSYTAIKDAYHSCPRTALGLSDHCLFILYQPTDRHWNKLNPVLRTVKDGLMKFRPYWWSVFEAFANNLDELTETVTSYISFCEDVCILQGIILQQWQTVVHC